MKTLGDEGLIPRIYREPLQLNNNNNPIQKWVKDLSTHFYKEDIRMAKKAHASLLNTTNYQEMQIKTALRYHVIPIRVATLNKRENSSTGKNVHCQWERPTFGAAAL